MPNVWNIGNTTVRNPKRIENALKVFIEEGFSGNAKGSEIEARLHGKFKEKGLLEFDGNASDWNGRKWRAVFYQLGFISYENYKIERDTIAVEKLFEALGLPRNNLAYQITPSGEKLISATRVPEIDDIYTKQFVCYELPNSLERGFPEGKMKPFILILQVLSKLQNLGEPGLNRFETGMFIQRFRDHTETLAEEIVEEILECRRKIGACKNSKEVKRVKEQYNEDLRRFSGIDPRSVVNDYSDTTFRYFSLSGLFTRIEDSIIIRPNKRAFVNKLLETEPLFKFSADPIEYFSHFYKNTYQIPTDIKDFALHEVEVLKAGIRDRTSPLLRSANGLTPLSDMLEIQRVRYELIEYNNWEREADFANEQQSPDSIKDIIKYLKVLNSETIESAPEIDDRPAFLEWAVWRSFLAINEIVNPIHQTRRFPLDYDFMPRNTAPGGGSDLIFEFETYVLAVEVTLTSSHRQMAVESEPVRRHTVQYRQGFQDKDVYCLFLAPKVDNNVAENFRIGVWYNGDEEEFVNIVPMELGDFIHAFEILLSGRINNEQFKNLLDRCLIFRNVRAPQWKQSINKEVRDWRRRLIARI